MALMLVLALPSSVAHRLSLILLHPESAVTTTTDEEAVQSQMERQRLLFASLRFAATHPLFGVGPGRFPDTFWEEGKNKGRHEAALGTHNSYTQLASECGLPALIAFIAAIVAAARSSFRLYRRTAGDPAQALANSIAFSCFLLTVSFAISIFFHHVAYAGNVSMILGLWVTLELATKSTAPQRVAIG
jgi:O-antigen ligase